MAQGSRTPQQLPLLDDPDVHAVGILPYKVPHHCIMSMNVDQYVVNPKLLAQMQPDGEQRRAADRNQTLRNSIGDRTQPTPMTSCEQECLHYILLAGLSSSVSYTGGRG